MAQQLNRYRSLFRLCLTVIVGSASLWTASSLLVHAEHNANQSKAGAKALDAKRSFEYLEKICKIGSRTTGTKGMIEQQQLLEKHFSDLGATILWQKFPTRNPQTGQNVEVKNMVVQWNPKKNDRVLICTHYDTRPFPSKDTNNPKGLFIGANDGASGTALLMELGNVIAGTSMETGVDFVFFDAEELVYDEQRDRGGYFIGSTYFAQSYVDNPTETRYRAGVLIDMIADADLQLYYEQNSFSFAKPLAVEIWSIAKQLKIKEFEPRIVHQLRDDHLPLNEIARIPVVDIIDFDYGKKGVRGSNYWHTMADTPDKCSGQSMVKVGTVLLEWLKKQP